MVIRDQTEFSQGKNNLISNSPQKQYNHQAASQLHSDEKINMLDEVCTCMVPTQHFTSYENARKDTKSRR